MSLRRRAWLWVVLLSTLMIVAMAKPALAAEPATLVLQAPDKVNLGEEVMITAVLKDSKGAPIAGAKIRLWTPGQFLSVGGEM
ncbi:MAG: hypothetical protein HY681_14940, partial [Chloroflexi bacterium]|nr:hypothetical protein [Chloroflexota bacterium]